MADTPHTPAAPPRGKITRIAVTYTVNTSDGPRHTFHGLIGMQRYVRPDRLRELEDDLTMICEDLLANRPQPVTGLPQDVVRIPFGIDPAPAVADECRAGAGGGVPGSAGGDRGRAGLPAPGRCSRRGSVLAAALGPGTAGSGRVTACLADTECGPGQMAEAACRLRDGVAACPADGYAVSSLSS